MTTKAKLMELMFIAKADLPAGQRKELISNLYQIIRRDDGFVIKLDDWGKKRLAYEMQDMTHGHYYLLTFVGSKNTSKSLDQFLKVHEEAGYERGLALRHMIILKQEDLSPEEVANLRLTTTVDIPDKSLPHLSDEEIPAYKFDYKGFRNMWNWLSKHVSKDASDYAEAWEQEHVGETFDFATIDVCKYAEHYAVLLTEVHNKHVPASLRISKLSTCEYCPFCREEGGCYADIRAKLEISTRTDDFEYLGRRIYSRNNKRLYTNCSDICKFIASMEPREEEILKRVELMVDLLKGGKK